MPRTDIAGFFWDDTPPPKVLKTKPKRNPPPRTWEEPDYLPHLAEAVAFDIDAASMTDDELLQASYFRDTFVLDIECYPNYFLAVFRSLLTGKLVFFDLIDSDDFGHTFLPENVDKLNWLLRSFCIITFNGDDYDIPILALAMAGCTTVDLWNATEAIIVYQVRAQDVLRKNKVKKLRINHVDLIEVAPLRASLKIYAGRLHCKRMQDLPFKPGTVLSDPQIAIVFWYCVNDVENTVLLYREVEEQIGLRERLGSDYGVDLRSKSDAQISETIMASEITRISGIRPRPPEYPEGYTFQYKVPVFITYTSPNMQWVLELVRNAKFTINAGGEVVMPGELKELEVPIGSAVYRMGVGGLHSTEKSIAHMADENTVLCDRDVASFYPAIKLNQNLFPQHLGINYITIYRRLVNQRLEAKRSGDKVTADSLKIAINGIFGKTGSPYSIVYSPHLLIQTTITGQLVVLMLIERIEAASIPIISANTDGVIIKCPKVRLSDLQLVIAQWERETSFETEETRYTAILARDVNNYVAIKEDGKVKVKGVYTELGSAQNSRLSKNPVNLICADAVIAFLTTGKPIAQSVCESRDLTRFLTVRTVKGGAVKNGEYLGKSIRWYYAKGAEGDIVYAINGNKVPRSENAKPCMTLPDVFPDDVDLDWYITEGYKILDEIGYNKLLESMT